LVIILEKGSGPLFDTELCVLWSCRIIIRFFLYVNATQSALLGCVVNKGIHPCWRHVAPDHGHPSPTKVRGQARAGAAEVIGKLDEYGPVATDSRQLLKNAFNDRFGDAAQRQTGHHGADWAAMRHQVLNVCRVPFNDFHLGIMLTQVADHGRCLLDKNQILRWDAAFQ
jgi:hypothetical protein